jgi:hypothetical protein
MSEEEIADEVRMIDSEMGWPRWPILPVKNVNRGDADYPEGEDVGVVLAGAVDRDGHWTIYFKNLWEFETGTLGPQLEGVKTKTFDTTEELVRAGWIGD